MEQLLTGSSMSSHGKDINVDVTIIVSGLDRSLQEGQASLDLLHSVWLR